MADRETHDEAVALLSEYKEYVKIVENPDLLYRTAYGVISRAKADLKVREGQKILCGSCGAKLRVTVV